METALKTTESGEGRPEKKLYSRPAYDVAAREDNYEIKVVLPGVSREGVRVSLDGRRLEIEGTRHHLPQKEWRTLGSEINWNDYRLVLSLNVDVDEDAISAKVEDGILTLELPKPEEAKPRAIEVK